MSPTGEPPSYSAELHEQLRRSLNNPFTLHSDKENIRVLLDQIEKLQAENKRLTAERDDEAGWHEYYDHLAGEGGEQVGARCYDCGHSWDEVYELRKWERK